MVVFRRGSIQKGSTPVGVVGMLIRCRFPWVSPMATPRRTGIHGLTTSWSVNGYIQIDFETIHFMIPTGSNHE